MAIGAHAKVAGVWREMAVLGVRSGGVWRTNTAAWTKVGGNWYQWWPPEAPPPSGPAPGTYILSPSSIYLGTYSGYAEFNTAFYRGYVRQISIRLSWRSNLVNIANYLRVAGRPSGTFYRNIDQSVEWENRTIDHRIDSFSAASLTEFNNGSSIGFNVDSGALSLGSISYIRLVIVV